MLTRLSLGFDGLPRAKTLGILGESWHSERVVVLTSDVASLPFGERVSIILRQIKNRSRVLLRCRGGSDRIPCYSIRSHFLSFFRQF